MIRHANYINMLGNNTIYFQMKSCLLKTQRWGWLDGSVDKVLATKLKDLISIQRTHLVEGESQFPQVVNRPHMKAVAMHLYK